MNPIGARSLFKSFVFRDDATTLGAPFVMYDNARPPRGDETIGNQGRAIALATSRPMKEAKP